MARGRRRRRRTLPEGLAVEAFGDRIELSRQPAGDTVPVRVERWSEIQRVSGADLGLRCPMCLQPMAPDPTTVPGQRPETSEHVPPFALGGRVRLRTCGPCNASGSAAEAELGHWWAQEREMRLEAPGVPGPRALGQVMLRHTRAGKFALIVSAGPKADIKPLLEALNGQPGTLTVEDYSGSYRVALLKSAFLAACLHLGRVPDSADADYTRRVLRNGRFPDEVPMLGVGETSVPMRVFRSFDATAIGPDELWTAVAAMPSTAGPVPVFGLILGQLGFVTWPMPDVRDEAIQVATRRRAG